MTMAKWKAVPLHKIAEVRTGIAKGKKGIKNPVSVPYLRVANVQDGAIDFSIIKKIEVEESQLQRYALQEGDVLMTEGGDYDKLGRGDVWRGEISPCLHQNHVFAVRPNTAILNPYFLAALSSSLYGKTYFLSCAKRSTNLASINSAQIKNFPVLLPSLREQNAIVSVTSLWDAAITCTQKLLDNSKQQKKALMQQLLTGRRRLPGFNTAWAKSMIRELSKRVTRKSDGKVHPILTISSTSGFVRQDSKYRRYMAGESVNNYILLYKGEFAYNKGNSKTYEFGCIFPLNNFETGLVPHVYVCFKIHSKYCAEFYKYLFENDYLKKQLGDMVNTGVRNNGLLNIKPEEFLCATLPVPPLDEQKAIAKVLTAADALIAQYEAKLAHLQRQKKALMQQLLTGKIRVMPDTPDTSGDASATPA